jgi:hypothetical protein
MIRSPSLLSLHSSILAAMGLAACSGDVSVVTGGSASAGSGAGGGTGTGAGTSTSNTTATGAGAGTSSSNTTATGTGGSTPVECAGAVPVLAADGADSGFARCPDGTIHRNQALACNPNAGVNACSGTEMNITCKLDSECIDHPHGRCASFTQSTFGGPQTACGCVYPCATDAECMDGSVCVCAGVVPTDGGWATCAPAACVTGAGCPSGECGISSFFNGCGTDVELACRSKTDLCRADTDCMPNTQCVLAGSPTWVCSGTTCAIGRPLLVGGQPRTASPVACAEWGADLTPDLGGLDAPTREALARHWLEVAALEHASVASFARFTLELLALGAPAALVAEAQRAGLDEVEHARLCYSLAGAYAGQPLGPGPLDLTGVTLRADRHEVLRSLVAEGCVGETLGVAEALAIGDRVTDPALRAAYARIAADEQRHAELAFRTLVWLLHGAGEETARFAARCIEEATAAAARDPEPAAFVAPERGVLAAAELGAIRRQALREVVRPCAAALLAELRPADARTTELHA